MNRFTAGCSAASVCLCIAATANAHYLWISVDRQPEARRGTNIDRLFAAIKTKVLPQKKNEHANESTSPRVEQNR